MSVLRASVIVPARDAAATLPRTLASLAAQEIDGEYEVIVVDDGSRDDTVALARAAGRPVTVIEQHALGPAAARNAGAAVARSGTLVFCDADVFPTAGWLSAGLDALQRADIVQGRVLPDPTAELGPFDRTLWIDVDAALFETANLFVSRAMFDRAGGFEEWLRPRSGKALAEDVWFGYKARRLGARATFSEAALAYHAVFPRDWTGYVLERRRLEYFPAMAAKMPELRRAFLHRRVFLNGRTARFDLALAGIGAALAGVPLGLLAAVPYARMARGHARRAGAAPAGTAAVAAADVAADAVGLSALVRGSIRHRSLLI